MTPLFVEGQRVLHAGKPRVVLGSRLDYPTSQVRWAGGESYTTPGAKQEWLYTVSGYGREVRERNLQPVTWIPEGGAK